MLNTENKIEQYLMENIKLLRSLDKLLINDISNNKHLLANEIYDFIEPLMSNYSSFSLLKRLLNEYIYDLNHSKTEKEYFINKVYKNINKLGNKNYIDIPDSTDKKSLYAFKTEYQSSIKGVLISFLLDENSSKDNEFKQKCKEMIHEKSEALVIFFIKKNIHNFTVEYQKSVSSVIKKYLRRCLSVELIYPIIDIYYFLMLTPKTDFEKQISRESTIEKLEADIIEVCTRVLERNQKGKSENEINDYLTDLLRSKNYNIADQTRSGLSLKMINSGEIDIMIRDNSGLPITIIECLKLSRVSSKGKNENLVNHFLKLIINYDGLGLSNKYLIVYSFADDFNEFKQDYHAFISSIKQNNNLKTLKIDSVNYLKNPYGNDVSNLTYISSFHKVNGVYQKITHYLINLKK